MPFSTVEPPAGRAPAKDFRPLPGKAPPRPAPSGASSFAQIRPGSHRQKPTELGPAGDQQLGALHARLAADATLPRAPKERPLDLLPGAAFPALPERLDLHPIYGASMRRWLELSPHEPGRAAMGLFRATLGDLAAILVHKPGKFGVTGPEIG
jgi:hypothetical protein